MQNKIERILNRLDEDDLSNVSRAMNQIESMETDEEITNPTIELSLNMDEARSIYLMLDLASHILEKHIYQDLLD
jgi:hypothetical protein